MEENMKTDLTFDQLKQIALNYRDAFKKVTTDQMQGDGFMQDGISYQRVSDAERQRVEDELAEQLEVK